MSIAITMDNGLALAAALRLQSWLSPAFPIGAFSYSHGLEYAVEAGLVTDRASLVDWLDAVLRHGSGRMDAILFAAAWRAADGAGLADVAALAATHRSTAELALEAGAQGQAFLRTVRAAWPHPALDRWAEELAASATVPTLPVAVAVACRVHGLPLRPALTLYLQAFLANLVSAAVRLVPLGQTDGQRAIAALEAAAGEASEAALAADLDDLGAATPMAEWTSIRHEDQYTRLFRS